MMRAALTRTGALGAAAVLSLLGGYVFLGFSSTGGISPLDVLRTALVVLSGFWLVWGGAAGIIGLFVRHRAPSFDAQQTPRGLTAILVPIYNEDPLVTFARVAAMNRSLRTLGIHDRFHIAILSDTTALEVAAMEAVWFQQLVAEPDSAGRIFYRRREQNIGKKAGNIEDFVTSSGGAYDYMLILDADSLMEGATIGEMARRMDADPDLGLLQTLPRIINARSFFGRSMQFSSAYLSPAFSRGASVLQGNEGPYWGHNAIVRVSAFAANCGLPVLSGKPPYGGHILSHDYVEAALLARGGWKVHLDPFLGGSFEEGPENLVEYAKRDRRWCQGNLQHRRLMFAPGLRLWSRFIFLQGIMAYLASPLWLVLMGVSILAAMMPEPAARPASELFIDGVWSLAAGVALLLVLPKVLILIRGVFDRENRRFGGTLRAGFSVLLEIIFSTLLAPILLMLQSRAVMQVLLGLDGGWPATQRSENHLDLRDSFANSWWIMLIGAVTMLATLVFAPKIALWVAPAMLPAVFAPVLISVSSRVATGKRAPWFFLTASEQTPSAVITEHHNIMAAWSTQGPLEPIIMVEARRIAEQVNA
ncbi:MAG: glucan biosynthesis glucosyltransferase [Devosia sp.]|uniref:glucans biosynthesis glucosyltransferase MdoH n=1 Tax=Devosia sp. TaxID=1871048 RepID=UPI002631F333|nr:glucans biosynthesis glucosyltransferase MdoH [Devosia sp.]MDB5528701.1 glucan biosynthesis glucosyltransferase [Devosia sp.]